MFWKVSRADSLRDGDKERGRREETENDILVMQVIKTEGLSAEKQNLLPVHFVWISSGRRSLDSCSQTLHNVLLINMYFFDLTDLESD